MTTSYTFYEHESSEETLDSQRRQQLRESDITHQTDFYKNFVKAKLQELSSQIGASKWQDLFSTIDPLIIGQIKNLL